MSSLYSSTVKLQSCSRCGLFVWTAWSEGVHIEADFIQLADRQAEIAMVMDGRTTYSFRAQRLIERDVDRIADRRLDTHLLAAHVCGKPIPKALRAPLPGTAAPKDSLECPF